MTRSKAIGLFFASPFIGLAYVIALPFVFVHQAIKNSRELKARQALR